MLRTALDEHDREALKLGDLADRLDAKRTELIEGVEALKVWRIDDDSNVLSDYQTRSEQAIEAASCFQREVEQLCQVSFLYVYL